MSDWQNLLQTQAERASNRLSEFHYTPQSDDEGYARELQDAVTHAALFIESALGYLNSEARGQREKDTRKWLEVRIRTWGREGGGCQ